MAKKKDELDRAKENVDMRETLSQFFDQLPEQIKFQQYTAKITRVKYDALIKEGFTEEQALELCKKVF